VCIVYCGIPFYLQGVRETNKNIKVHVKVKNYRLGCDISKNNV